MLTVTKDLSLNPYTSFAPKPIASTSFTLTIEIFLYKFGRSLDLPPVTAILLISIKSIPISLETLLNISSFICSEGIE